MDFELILSYVTVILKEIWQKKFVAILLFGSVSFLVLVMGMLSPSNFETSATIFADNQNILRPLLQNQAEQTAVKNQTTVVKEMLQSPSLLQAVVERLYPANQFASAEQLGQKINQLRGRIKVLGLGSGYIKISYSDDTAEEAYKVINTVIDVFIKTSSEEQRSESREAFLFIDNQVKQYKDQLVLAEERLKEFRAFNFDGRDGDVDGSIARLREQVEGLKIAIEEDETTISSLQKQLENEDQFAVSAFKADVYSQHLEDLQARLSSLLLVYTEDYPDVVSLKYQIEDVKERIRQASQKDDKSQVSASEEDKTLNPLYQELRSRLSQTTTEKQAKIKRVESLNELLEKEYERRARVAERSAEEAELTRDYNVTKKIYEDMLERKEKARLSMTLNIEGQGVTYRVQEPALPPLNPTGLRFLHFVLAGPIVGGIVTIAIFVVLVIVDPRVRFPERLSGLGVPVLAIMPHMNTPVSKRVFKVDIALSFCLILLILACYLGLAYASKIGAV